MPFSVEPTPSQNVFNREDLFPSVTDMGTSALLENWDKRSSLEDS
jgi:hypothetical protein